MSNQSIQIKRATIIWILVIVILFSVILVVFSRIDHLRKFNQFEAINNTVLNSTYPDRISAMMNSFSIDDTSAILKIQEILYQLDDEFDDISDATLYFPLETDYIEFYSYSNHRYKVTCELVHYLSRDLKMMKKYLDRTENPDLNELFKLQDKNYNVFTLMKVGKGYLYLSYYR